MLFLLVNEGDGAPARKGRPRIRPKASPPTVNRRIPEWTAIVPVTASTATELPDETKDTDKKGTKKKQPKKTPRGSTKSAVFESFTAVAESKLKQPFLIYFYLPEDEKAVKLDKACGAFEEAMANAAAFHISIEAFGRYTCDAKKLDKKLRTQYARTVPYLVLFDHTGRKVYALTRFPRSEKSLVKKLEAIKKRADKALGKASPPKGKAKRSKAAKKEKGLEKKGGDENGEGEER
jgi:hypothetical protein